MDQQKELEKQYKKHIYNRNFKEKQLLKDHLPEPKKKVGRPPKVEVNKTVLASFTPLQRGRPKKNSLIVNKSNIRPFTAPPTITRSKSVPSKSMIIDDNFYVTRPLKGKGISCGR